MGSIRGGYERYPHLTALLPAMGYSDVQRHELEETINRVPCDLVVVATPVDLARIISVNKPCIRIGYEIDELTRPGLTDLLQEFTSTHRPTLLEA